MRWVSKFNKRKQQVELSTNDARGMTAISIVVGLDGYDWKHYVRDSDRWGRTTRGLNIHFSLNGPLQMTFAEFEKFLLEARAVVEDAEATLIKDKESNHD